MIPYAAIDVGSNAIRMLIVNADGKTPPRVVYSTREPIRLGRDVFENGLLSKAIIARTEAAFARFAHIIERSHVHNVRAVATSALREAKNRDELLKAVRRSSGIQLEVISAREEARLIHLALTEEFDLRGQLALLIDIGGGSVEVTLVSDGDIIFADSLRLGTVRMLQLLETQQKGEKLFASLLREYAEGVHRQLKRVIRGRNLAFCIGSGGNVEALGELQSALLERPGQGSISLKDLAKVIREVRRLSLQQRMRKLGMRPDRADVVLPAARVLSALAAFSKIVQVEVARGGVKEGIVIDLARQHLRRHVPTQSLSAARAKQVRSFALELGRQHAFDEQHGLRVARFALQLFDATHKLHRLDSTARLQLETAALLHDIGQCINYSGHHKHTFYLIKCCPFVGLTEREQLMVASIARYHRKSAPRPEHEAWAELSPQERKPVLKLAAILRIAAALHQEHSTRRGSIKVAIKVKSSVVRLQLRGKGSFELERWSAQQKSALFEQVFKRSVEIH